MLTSDAKTRQAEFSAFFRGVQSLLREPPRAFDQRAVPGQIAESKRWQAALLLAEQFARTTQFQVFFGDAEAVGRFLQHLQSLPCLGSFDVGDQNTVSLVGAASDAAA